MTRQIEMRGTRAGARAGLLVLVVAGCTGAGPRGERGAAAAGEELRFCLREGEGHNCLLRDRVLATHVIASSGARARLIAAFPPENSGVAFWATPLGGGEAQLSLEEPLASFEQDGLRGVRFGLVSSRGLALERVVLGSMRVIRDYQALRSLEGRDRVIEGFERLLPTLPPALRATLAAQGLRPGVLRARARVELTIRQRAPALLEARGQSLDGAQRFLLRLRAPAGRLEGEAGAPRLVAAGPGPLRLEVEAASTLAPYRGLGERELLRPTALEHLRRLRERPTERVRYQQLAAAARSLAFLSTDRKFLAGSWRFLTYFGRDTLMSLWLLQPALAPAALESGLQSVLDRLSPEGDVAHEESLGDQAALERLAAFTEQAAAGRLAELAGGLPRLSQPVYDYKMVDDDLMLAPLLALYLEDPEVGGARARSFLAARGASGRSNLEALAANLAFVLRRVAPYAASGRAADLIALKDKLPVGDWRDSEEGLGGGRYASSVNAYLAPTALDAILRLLRSPRLDRAALMAAARRGGHAELTGEDLERRVQAAASRWEHAREHFAVRLDAGQVRERLRAFLASAPVGRLERELLRAAPLVSDGGGDQGEGVSLGAVVEGAAPPLPREGLAFDALSLDAAGRPIEVMHTDDAFALLARDLPAGELSRRLLKYERRYPLGLDDRFGVYVANPALSPRRDDLRTFDRAHYHGTVVWSWQLGLLQRGLLRQLERCRLLASRDGAELAGRLQAILARLARAEARVGPLRGSELWTVRALGDRLMPAAFGSVGHADESNALQLWSDVSLGVDLERSRLLR